MGEISRAKTNRKFEMIAEKFENGPFQENENLIEYYVEPIEYYVEPNEYQNEQNQSDEVIFDQSHDQINLQMIEIEQEIPNCSTMGLRNELNEESSGCDSRKSEKKEILVRPGRKAAIPDEDLDEKALNRRNR